MKRPVAKRGKTPKKLRKRYLKRGGSRGSKHSRTRPQQKKGGYKSPGGEKERDKGTPPLVVRKKQPRAKSKKRKKRGIYVKDGERLSELTPRMKPKRVGG